MISQIKGKLIWIADRVEAAVTGYLFDRWFGVETRKTLDRSDLGVEGGAGTHAWSYEPCSYPRFRRIMKRLPAAAKELTFVDIGSGKGRQLIAAAVYGFPRIIGIELSPILHAKAEQNIASFRRRSHSTSIIRLESMDATRMVLPGEACLLWAFNPFQEPGIREFLASLTAQIRSRAQPLYLAYIHPTVRRLFDESGLFEPVAELPWPTDAVIYRLRLPRADAPA
jgi:hypothetical protein